MSERTYKLLDGFILTEKNGRLYLHEGNNTPVPVPAPHTLIGDLLALVDSLQQQLADRTQTIAEQRETLEFYAEDGNYLEHIIGWGPEIPVIRDGGRRARKSLGE